MTENNQNDINNPHDKFFKAAFSWIEIARPLIEQFLPKDLIDQLDLDTLKIDPNSYINDELKETFSDLVWSCHLKDSTEQRNIAFLLEHKSFKPDFPHFQLLEYQLGAWKTQRAAQQKLVPIIPIVLYHGKEKWQYEAFDSYFGAIEPSTLRFMPCFDYIFINLQDYSDAQIKRLHSIFLQKVLISFKHYLDKNYLKLNIVEILFVGYDSTINELTLSFIKLFSVYLANISGVSQKIILQEAFNSKNNLNPEIMSIVDEIIEIGIEKGIEIGKERDIINLYKKGVTIDLIADYLEHPIDKVKRIINEYLTKSKNQ